MSPLYVAVNRRSFPIIQYLISNGADPNMELGLSCLKLAKDLNDIRLINFLVDSGAKQQVRRNHSRLRARISNISFSKTKPEIGLFSNSNSLCTLCQSSENLFKLIPCGHRVVCEKCLDNFIGNYHTCPICHMSYYATSET